MELDEAPDENQGPQVSYRNREDAEPECVKSLREMYHRVNKLLSDSRIAKEKRSEVNREMLEAITKVEEDISAVEGIGIPSDLLKELKTTLERRGIKDLEDWKAYVKTIERDGEILADICGMLDTTVLQVQEAVKDLQRKSKEYDMEVQGKEFYVKEKYQGLEKGRKSGYLQEPMTHSTGPCFAEGWRQRSSTAMMDAPALEEPGSLSRHLLTYLRSLAVADPGVFKGDKNEDFKEFVRRFRRKYDCVIGCESTMMEIMGDDHLAGRAKSIFRALSREVRERGFEAVTSEMAKLLASDSTAGRMRALTELRNLSIRPNQDVAEFCLTLERLGQEANPECSIEDRSMEYAQILLDNLSNWPEHYQLVGTLHRVQPRKAYEEIKQLALSIEQSKAMFKTGKGSPGQDWRERAAQYRGLGRTREVEGEARRLSLARGMAASRREVRSEGHPIGAGSPRPHGSTIAHQGATTAGRRCYNCSNFGHFAKDCPEKVTGVNQIEPEKSLSSIIKQARSLGVTVMNHSGESSELVGDRIVGRLSLLDSSHLALLDTGSMISIIPIEVLGKAQDRGYNVDSLNLIEKSELRPVFDASNNRMRFLGAVHIEAELEGGMSCTVPFYISDSKSDEIIIGTSVLRKLGVNVSIARKESGTTNNLDSIESGRVTVVRRVYVPPRESGLVSVQCSKTDVGKVERVIWPSKTGIAAGVFEIQNRETVIPVFNKSDGPMILKEGEEVGHWGTDKWHQRWEEVNPLMLDSEEINLSKEERWTLLKEFIAKNSDEGRCLKPIEKI